MRTLPKASERLSCEIGMLAFWLPKLLAILESSPKKKSQKYDYLFFTGPGLAEMSNGCSVLNKKMCPDPLEALKPSRDPIKCFKMGVGGSDGVKQTTLETRTPCTNSMMPRPHYGHCGHCGHWTLLTLLTLSTLLTLLLSLIHI